MAELEFRSLHLMYRVSQTHAIHSVSPTAGGKLIATRVTRANPKPLFSCRLLPTELALLPNTKRPVEFIKRSTASASLRLAI